jgi:hypothetical protein
MCFPSETPGLNWDLSHAGKELTDGSSSLAIIQNKANTA